MRAAVLSAPGHIDLITAPVPTPPAGHALIRVRACGVCASNVPRWQGRPWFSYPSEPGEMGHEGVGEVVALGAGVKGLAPGERVAFLSNHAYAEFDLASACQIVPVPAALHDIDAPGEPLACAWNAHRRANIHLEDTVAIVGGGFFAALLAQLAITSGADVLLVARRPVRGLDVEHIPFGDALAEVERRTNGRLCDVVIEATGAQEPLDLAAKLARERGRLVVAGYHQDGPRQVDMQLWNWRGLDVINAHERDPAIYVEGMRRAFAAVVAGELDPRPFLTHHLPLTALGEALDLTARRPEGFVKAIVHP